MSGTTSISTLVLFIAILTAFGVFFPSLLGYFTDVSKSQKYVVDKNINVKNTDFELMDATYSSDTATVVLDNTGSKSLSTKDLTVLLDGEYVDFSSNATIIEPRESAQITVSSSVEPNVVKIVSKNGISRLESY